MKIVILSIPLVTPSTVENRNEKTAQQSRQATRPSCYVSVAFPKVLVLYISVRFIQCLLFMDGKLELQIEAVDLLACYHYRPCILDYIYRIR